MHTISEQEPLLSPVELRVDNTTDYHHQKIVKCRYRNLLMHGFHLLVMCVAGNAVRDTQCGFKVPFLRNLGHAFEVDFSLSV